MSVADARRRLFWRMVSGSLWRRRERVMIALSAVAIGISVGAGLLLVSRDVERMVSRELRVYGPNLLVQPRGDEAATGMRDVKVGAMRTRDTFPLPEPGWDADASTPAGPVHAETVLPLLYGSARATLPMKWETVVVAGTDLATLGQLYSGWSFTGIEGRKLSPDSLKRPHHQEIAYSPGRDRGRAIVGADAARRIGVVAGDTLRLDPLASGGQPVTLKIIAIFQSGSSEDAVVYLPRADAERLLAMPGRASVVLVRAVGQPRAIEAALAQGWLSSNERQVTALRQLTGAARELLGRLRALLTAVTVFALVTASLCTMSTLTDLVLERRREIALLKSLGARQRDVVLLFLAEAATLGLAGGLAGFLIGAAAAQVVGASVFHTAIRLDLRVLPAALALALAVTVVSSLPPVRYALALDPARALRGD